MHDGLLVFDKNSDEIIISNKKARELFVPKQAIQENSGDDMCGLLRCRLFSDMVHDPTELEPFSLR
jgi:hypothetical protein